MKINTDPLEQVGILSFMLIPVVAFILAFFQWRKVRSLAFGYSILVSPLLIFFRGSFFLRWPVFPLGFLAAFIFTILFLIFIGIHLKREFKKNQGEYIFLILIGCHFVWIFTTHIFLDLPFYTSTKAYLWINWFFAISGGVLLIRSYRPNSSPIVLALLVYPLFEGLKILFKILPPYATN